MTAQTITVQNSFGLDVEINEADFIARWSLVPNQFYDLAVTREDYDLVQRIQNQVVDMAARKFAHCLAAKMKQER